MIRGSARFRSLLVQRLHAGDRLADASSRARARMPTTREQLRRAPAILGPARRAAAAGRLAGAALPAGPRDRWLPGVAGRRVAVVDVHVAVALHDGGRRDAGHACVRDDGRRCRRCCSGTARSRARSWSSGALPLGDLGRVPARAHAHRRRCCRRSWRRPRTPRTRSGATRSRRGDLGPLVCFALAPFVFHALVRASAAERDRRRGRGVAPPAGRRTRPGARRARASGCSARSRARCGRPAILLALVLSRWRSWSRCRSRGGDCDDRCARPGSRLVGVRS